MLEKYRTKAGKGFKKVAANKEDPKGPDQHVFPELPQSRHHVACTGMWQKPPGSGRMTGEGRTHANSSLRKQLRKKQKAGAPPQAGPREDRVLCSAGDEEPECLGIWVCFQGERVRRKERMKVQEGNA